MLHTGSKPLVKSQKNTFFFFFSCELDVHYIHCILGKMCFHLQLSTLFRKRQTTTTERKTLVKQINWNVATVKILWFRENRSLQMSRSRSLSYCSRSYSCRLIRFTRRRRRSGTAWGLEEEPHTHTHTHTSACTCTHTVQTFPNIQQ